MAEPHCMSVRYSASAVRCAMMLQPSLLGCRPGPVRCDASARKPNRQQAVVTFSPEADRGRTGYRQIRVVRERYGIAHQRRRAVLGTPRQFRLGVSDERLGV